MSKEALVAAVKKIAQLSKAGDLEGAYQGYLALFASPDFAANRPEDQRQALKLMVHAKLQAKTETVIEAHRAALSRLSALVDALHEPADYEMLGICQELLGDVAAAGASYQAGLNIERARDAGSVLCGTLMRRVSSV